MKLASYKDGSRDGQLVVVSRDLSTAHYATGMAGTLQQLLDDWNFIAPQLQDLYVTLNQGKARHAFPFEPRMCMAPLPRPHQWVTAVAPAAPGAGPVLRQGASGDGLGPTADLVLADEAWAAALEPQLVAVTGDVPQGVFPALALERVRLLLLAGDLALQALAPAEQAQGVGPWQSRPATVFGPLAITPDELGAAWRDGRAHLTLQAACNGRPQPPCATGDMPFHFGQLIAQLCRTRPLRAGALVGSGPGAGAPALGGADGLRHGDVLRIEARDRDGHSPFGAIEQSVVPLD